MRLIFHPPAGTLAIDPQKAENMNEINEKLMKVSALGRMTLALDRALLARGINAGPIACGEALAEAEQAAWQGWEAAKTAAWGLALWPCGHVQALNLETRALDWEPRPTHWRTIYVPPSLISGARYKTLPGSLVSRWKQAVPVRGQAE